MRFVTLSKPIISAGIFLALASQSVDAQTRRMILYQSTVRGHVTVEMEAYLSETVDECPEFPGGEVALQRFINKERRYPAEAYRGGVQGRVLCGFVVAPDGSICNIEVLRGVSHSLNREAVRIVQNMPKWHPGRIGDEKVPVYCVIPIPFRL